MSAPSNEPSQKYPILLTRLLGSKDWPRALEVARAWLAEDPSNFRAHRAAGLALINLTCFGEAAAHLNRALGTRPNDAYTHRLASAACFQLKQSTQADAHIERALELQPNDAAHWYHLAWMRHQQGKLTEAAKHARRAHELAPNDSHIVNLLALCENHDDITTLRKEYRRALALDPENSAAHNNLGLYYLNVDGDYEAAADAFRESLRLNPHDKTARHNLTVVFRRYSLIYQLLRMPVNTFRVWLMVWRSRSWIARTILIIFSVAGAHDILPMILTGLVFLHPASKLHERLTLSDLNAWMGVPGARRGGLLGQHAWPFAARMTVFALLTFVYWNALYTLMNAETFLHYAHQIPIVGKVWF